MNAPDDVPWEKLRIEVSEPHSDPQAGSTPNQNLPFNHDPFDPRDDWVADSAVHGNKRARALIWGVIAVFVVFPVLLGILNWLF